MRPPLRLEQLPALEYRHIAPSIVVIARVRYKPLSPPSCSPRLDHPHSQIHADRHSRNHHRHAQLTTRPSGIPLQYFLHDDRLFRITRPRSSVDKNKGGSKSFNLVHSQSKQDHRLRCITTRHHRASIHITHTIPHQCLRAAQHLTRQATSGTWREQRKSLWPLLGESRTGRAKLERVRECSRMRRSRRVDLVRLPVRKRSRRSCKAKGTGGTAKWNVSCCIQDSDYRVTTRSEEERHSGRRSRKRSPISIIWKRPSTCPQDQVHSRIRIDNIAHLPRPKRKRRILQHTSISRHDLTAVSLTHLERLLHLLPRKPT